MRENQADWKAKELSSVDERILKLLGLKGVRSENYISKKLGLNVATIKYHLKMLKKNHVIANERWRLNRIALGFPASAWVFLVLRRGSYYRNVMNELLKYPEVKIVFFIGEDYDLCAKVIGKNQEEIMKKIFKIENECKQFLRNSAIVFSAKVFKNHNIEIKDVEPAALDNTDIEILKLRTTEPEIKIAEMAKRLKVHRNTVSGKWQDFVKNKIVLKKSVIINPDYYYFANVGFTVLMVIDTEIGMAEKLAKELMQYDEVHELTRVASQNDLFALVRTNSLKNFMEFHRKVYMNHAIASHIVRLKNRVVLDAISNDLNHSYELEKLSHGKNHLR